MSMQHNFEIYLDVLCSRYKYIDLKSQQNKHTVSYHYNEPYGNATYFSCNGISF